MTELPAQARDLLAGNLPDRSGTKMTFQLTPDEIKALRDAQPALRNLEDLIARLERVGLDMGPERAELQRRKIISQGMLREFGRPASPRSGHTP